jgi:plasmid stabilization system protein ParE
MVVEFHPAASQELEAASLFYEGRRAGLGEELADEIEDVCLLLSEYASIGRKVDEVHRSVPLRRFPFTLFYRVRGTVVQIVAVAHKRKRPGYWRRRR